MVESSFFILFLIATLTGFFLGRWVRFSRKKKVLIENRKFSNEYFVGLNYLLNEQTDEAINTFIKALEVSIDNVDTYIVIGRLFRRRGEIEKAIQTHQDILARPSLTREQSLQVQLELAHDYLKAGLLDRAEALLIELGKTEWQSKIEAVKSLLTVYEQEKEWQKAIDLIMELPHIDEELSIQAGHYHAELAELYLSGNDLVEARKYIRKSLTHDRKGVRALLQMGRLEYTQGNFREATRVLQKIVHKNPLFISESIPLLEKCYDHIHSGRGFSAFLAYCLKHHPSVVVIAAAARRISVSQSDREAGQFVAEQVIRHPSLKGLAFLIDYQIHETKNNELQQLTLLKGIMQRLLDVRPVYRCSQCGFEGKELYWRCPRCHAWGGIEPITGLEGQ